MFNVLIRLEIEVLTQIVTLYYSLDMATEQNPLPNVSVRPTEEDRKILDALSRKLGVGVSQVLRIAIRALAEKEGLAA